MKLIDTFFDVLFPNICGFCEKINKDGLCEDCEKKLKLKLIFGINEYENMYFNKHIYIMKYDDIREKLLDYKFHDKSYLYKTFAKIILKDEKICEILKSCDTIIPVPIHKNRKKTRGYNQSELIAKEIAKNISEIKYANAIKKVKDNQKQSLLDEKSRADNVKDAYEIANKEIIYNKRIILFDDIYTTGSTVNECSKILKQNGAIYILVLSIAK